MRKPSKRLLLFISLLGIILLLISILYHVATLPTPTLPTPDTDQTNGSDKKHLTWSVQTVDQGSIAAGSSVAVDSEGNAHVSYCSITNEQPFYYNLRYAKWNGSSWNTQTVDSSPSSGEDSSIAVDSQGFPHITFFDRPSESLKYTKWNGSTWTTLTVDVYVKSSSSIALDSEDNPHVAYWDNEGLWYAKWMGAGWIREKVDSCMGFSGDRTIALDSNSNPYIVYRNEGLKMAKWDASKWVIEAVASGDAFVYSVAIDSNNLPHVSYCNTYSDGYLTYAHLNGTAWNIQTVNSTRDGRGTSIALDSNDYPHISCTYPDHGFLGYAAWNGSAWNTQTFMNTPAGWPTSIALDSKNIPHVNWFTNRSSTYPFNDGALTHATLLESSSD